MHGLKERHAAYTNGLLTVHIFFFIDGIRVSVVFEDSFDDSQGEKAAASAANNPQPTLSDLTLSLDPAASDPGANENEREFWAKPKTLYLISKYKELNERVKKGGFR